MTQPNQPNVQSQGVDALSQNVMNVRAVANIIGQTLGPQGIDVHIINNVGESITSNDGATILQNLAVNNPVINSLVESAGILADRVGDGTTTMTIMAGRLCYGGLILREEDYVDPVTTCKGYQLAHNYVNQLLDKYSQKVDLDNRDQLKQFVKTTLTGKNTEGLDEIYEICVDAVLKAKGDLTKINKLKLNSDSVNTTKLISGMVLDVSILHDKMPKTIINPKILILDEGIELVNPAVDLKLNISDQDQYFKLLNMEKESVIKKAEKIKELGADVVICQRDIKDYAIDYFVKNDMIAIRNVPKNDIELLAKSIKASVIKNIDTATPEDLGEASIIEIKRLTEEDYVIINNEDSNVATILIGGANRISRDEYERGIDDALGVIKTLLKHNSYVYGAGNIEVRLAYDLREYAKTIENGKIQSAIEQYAQALEQIPKLLADSSGQNRLLALGKLRVNREQNFGIDVDNADVRPMLGVLEPTEVKKQAYTIATEYAMNVLRIGYILQGRMDK